MKDKDKTTGQDLCRDVIILESTSVGEENYLLSPNIHNGVCKVFFRGGLVCVVYGMWCALFHADLQGRVQENQMI